MSSKYHGFSKAQRNRLLERDKFCCQFPLVVGNRLTTCGEVSLLQAHHIWGQRWCQIVVGSNFPANSHRNGIMLCEKHHLLVHPDIAETFGQRLRYVLPQILAKREALCKMGVPYWNTEFDAYFLAVSYGEPIKGLFFTGVALPPDNLRA